MNGYILETMKSKFIRYTMKDIEFSPKVLQEINVNFEKSIFNNIIIDINSGTTTTIENKIVSKNNMASSLTYLSENCRIMFKWIGFYEVIIHYKIRSIKIIETHDRFLNSQNYKVDPQLFSPYFGVKNWSRQPFFVYKLRSINDIPDERFLVKVEGNGAVPDMAIIGDLKYIIDNLKVNRSDFNQFDRMIEDLNRV